MEIGVQMAFSAWGYDSMTDSQVYAEEIKLGLLAEELGFDALWPAEHHFRDYSFCPDNTQFLSFMAGKTKRIKLATGAVIIPWNNPLRVAEKIAMLDELSGGRVIYGMGRGLSRKEYGFFGIDMAESRDRFDEPAPMILEALETGSIEGDGPFYPQPRAAIRPRPTRSFKDRITCVGMSPDSAEAAARIGARLVQFSQKNWKEVKGSIDGYNALFRQLHNREPDLPMLSDFTFLDADAGRAEERARKHLTSYFLSVMDNYEMGSEHFQGTKGYSSYAKGAEVIRHMGLERVAEAYIEVNAWGTPQQVLDKLEQRRAIVGDFHMTSCFRYGGIPYAEAENSMRLFATQVMPELRRWKAQGRTAAAAE